MTSNANSQGQPALWEGLREDQSPADEAQGAVGETVHTTKHRPTAPMEFSDLWTIDEVANYLGVPKQTIYCWRTTGYGPQGFRVGKHLRWRAAAVIAWTLEMERGQ